MKFVQLDIPGVYLIDHEKKTDHRGYFARIYCENEFQENGLNTKWVQMNQSLTKKKGALRGLHFQRNPMAEIKLVRCIQGAVLDVIVDLREGSETYGEKASVHLSPKNQHIIYIPAGFAHGFQTLEKNSILFYMHSEFYSPKHEGGVLYSDPGLNINWPLSISDISERDQAHPYLNELKPISV